VASDPSKRRTVALMLVLLVGTACSIRTPRDGFTVSAERRSEAGGIESASPTGDVGAETLAPGDGASGTEALSQDDGSSAGATRGPASPNSATGAQGTGRQAGAANQPSGAAAGPKAAPKAAGPVGSTVGVGSDTITISVIAPFSGAIGAIVTSLYEAGYGTWVDDVNASGGILGRKVVVKRIDDKNTTDGEVAACKEAASNGSFMTFILRASSDTGADCLNDAGIPVLATAVAEPKVRRHVHALFVERERGPLLARYTKGPLGDGGKKLGVIHLRDGRNTAIKDAYVAEAKKLGMNVVSVEAVQENQASFTSELLRLRGEGAETVALFVNTELLGILRDAKVLGYQPRFTGVSWCADEISAAGGELLTGVQCLRAYTTSESPAFQAFLEKHRKHARGGVPNTTAMWAYGMGLLTGRALDGAGRNPTRESLQAGYNSIQGYDTQIVPRVSWSPTEMIGTHAQFPVVCCNPDKTWKLAGPASDRF
jgi:branched-chain amino acid transport system substrate-binding protein